MTWIASLPERFVPLSPLPEGAWGPRRRALDQETGTQVGIEWLGGLTSQARAGHAAQLRVHRDLSHPALLRIYDVHVAPAGSFLTTDLYAPSVPLGALDEERRLEHGERLAALFATCRAAGFEVVRLDPSWVSVADQLVVLRLELSEPSEAPTDMAVLGEWLDRLRLPRSEALHPSQRADELRRSLARPSLAPAPSQGLPVAHFGPIRYLGPPAHAALAEQVERALRERARTWPDLNLAAAEEARWLISGVFRARGTRLRIRLRVADASGAQRWSGSTETPLKVARQSMETIVRRTTAPLHRFLAVGTHSDRLPSAARPDHARGARAMRAGRVDEAVTSFARARDRTPAAPLPRVAYALACAVRAETVPTSESATLADDALARISSRDEPLTLLALAYRAAARGDYEGEIAQLRRALARGPHLAAVQIRWGDLEIRRGRRLEGIGRVKDALELEDRADGRAVVARASVLSGTRASMSDAGLALQSALYQDDTDTLQSLAAREGRDVWVASLAGWVLGSRVARMPPVVKTANARVTGDRALLAAEALVYRGATEAAVRLLEDHEAEVFDLDRIRRSRLLRRLAGEPRFHELEERLEAFVASFD